jgi:hypothetical protein
MSENKVKDPGPWINTPLRAAGSWIFLAALLLGVDGVYTYVDAHKTAEKNIRIIRESRYERFKHEGSIYTKEEVIKMMRGEPLRKAVPHMVLSLLLALCLAGSFKRPLHSTIAALALAAVGGVAASVIRHTLPLEKALLYAFVVLTLLLGVKASYRYHRWVSARENAADEPGERPTSEAT